MSTDSVINVGVLWYPSPGLILHGLKDWVSLIHGYSHIKESGDANVTNQYVVIYYLYRGLRSPRLPS